MVNTIEAKLKPASSAFHCKGCGSTLGHVRDGILIVKNVTVRGRADILCSCGSVRTWYPEEEYQGRRFEEITDDIRAKFDLQVTRIDELVTELRKCV